MPYRSLTKHLDSDIPPEPVFIAPILEESARWKRKPDARGWEGSSVMTIQGVAVATEMPTDAKPEDEKDEVPEAERPSYREPTLLSVVSRSMRNFKVG